MLALTLTLAYEFTYMYKRRSRKMGMVCNIVILIHMADFTLPCQGHKKFLLPTQELQVTSVLLNDQITSTVPGIRVEDSACICFLEIYILN